MSAGSFSTMHGDRRWRLMALVAVVALLVMAAPLLPWLAARSTSSEAWTGLLLIAVGVALLARSTTTAPSSRHPSTAVSVGVGVGGAAIFLAGVGVDVRLLQAAGVAAVATSVLAVWSPGRGLGLAPLLLVLLGLPLSGDIDVVGFPLRRLSAELAALALPVLGVPVAFAETVLVTEHGLADVEAPCAGLSTLRLLLASVATLAALRGSRSKSLLAALGVAVAVAILGNASRVTLLSFLVLGARAPDLAALLHVPLGVLVFLAAAAAAVPLLPSARPRATTTTTTTTTTTASRTAAVLVTGVALVAALAGSGLRAMRPARGEAAPLAARPVGVTGGLDLPLSTAEAELYGRHALLARKRRLLDDRGREVGAALVVVTRGLRAIHAPERCLAGNGHVVVDSAVVDRADMPVKRLVLDGGGFVGLSLLRSTRGRHATDLGDVALARIGVGGPRDDGPWVFISAVVRTDLVTVADEDAIVARLVGDAATLVTTSGLPP